MKELATLILACLDAQQSYFKAERGSAKKQEWLKVSLSLEKTLRQKATEILDVEQKLEL